MSNELTIEVSTTTRWDEDDYVCTLYQGERPVAQVVFTNEELWQAYDLCAVSKSPAPRRIGKATTKLEAKTNAEEVLLA